MISSFFLYLLDGINDMLQNSISTFIFLIILFLVISLLFSIFSKSCRELLVKIKILEKNEDPKSLFFWLVSMIIIVQLVKTFVVQPFRVEGMSMFPTYDDKQFLLVDKFSYLTSNPSRGDVVIFKLYENLDNPYEGKYLIKRLIGLPGERVVVNGGVTTIYNKENPDGFQIEEPYVENKDFSKNTDITLEDDEYFVMGDNREKSYDSRYWGPLHKEYLKGQVLFRIFPFSSLDYEPGRYKYSK